MMENSHKYIDSKYLNNEEVAKLSMMSKIDNEISSSLHQYLHTKDIPFNNPVRIIFPFLEIILFERK